MAAGKAMGGPHKMGGIDVKKRWTIIAATLIAVTLFIWTSGQSVNAAESWLFPVKGKSLDNVSQWYSSWHEAIDITGIDSIIIAIDAILPLGIVATSDMNTKTNM